MALVNTEIPEPPGFHPAGRCYRFVVLFFVSLLTYGSYFAYDSVGAIPDQLMKVWGVDQAAIGALYSLYSLAAIVTLLFGVFSSTVLERGHQASLSLSWSLWERASWLGRPTSTWLTWAAFCLEQDPSLSSRPRT